MRYTTYPVHTLMRGERVPSGAAVVIDTLRMTTVASTALANGCKALYAVGEVEKAVALAQPLRALLGGERGAQRIPGFDLSNSPLEYTFEQVSGRNIVMTTTNGTQAIASCDGAQRLYLACLRNAGAAAERLRGEEDVTIVLAGTGGRFSLEDAYTAGAILDRLPPGEMDDMSIAALAIYRQNRQDVKALLRPCGHFRRLERLGFGADLDYCLTENVMSVIPCLQSLENGVPVFNA